MLKRRHGLNRCRYRGYVGMQRWVGLAVMADNLINIGRVLAANDPGEVLRLRTPLSKKESGKKMQEWKELTCSVPDLPYL